MRTGATERSGRRGVLWWGRAAGPKNEGRSSQVCDRFALIDNIRIYFFYEIFYLYGLYFERDVTPQIANRKPQTGSAYL